MIGKEDGVSPFIADRKKRSDDKLTDDTIFTAEKRLEQAMAKVSNFQILRLKQCGKTSGTRTPINMEWRMP